MVKKIWIISMFTILSVPVFSGGGWTKEKGSGYYKLGQWWVVSDKHFTGSGGIDPNGTRGTFLTSIYGEYGFTDRITGVVYFPFFARSLVYDQVSETTGQLIQPGEAINSVGDIDLSMKYGLIRDKPFVVSATLTLGIPTGNDSGGSDGSLQTGDGEFNQMIRIDASRSVQWGQTWPYFSGYAAFNNRTNGFSDEFRYGIETGLTKGKFTFLTRLYGVVSFKNGQNNFNSSGTSIFGNDAEYLTVSPELAFNFSKKVGVSANLIYPISGKLIFSSTAYSFGVFLNM